MPRIVFLLLLVLTVGLGLNTQDNPPPAPMPVPNQANVPPPPQENAAVTNAPVNEPPFDKNAVPTKTNLELGLSIAVLGFGGIITLALIWFLAKRTEKSSLDQLIDLIKYPIVLVIIIGGLFLVTAGYGNQQIAPIIGLMGTIAGYLMGKSRNSG